MWLSFIKPLPVYFCNFLSCTKLFPIKSTKLFSLEALSLSNNQICEIPDAISQLVNLKELSIWGNKISNISEAITQLNNLEDIDLSYAQLTLIPHAITQISSLKRLHLGNNQISEIPNEIGQLTNLRWLYLYNNEIREIPISIAQITNLQVLSLYSNQISEIPEAVCQLLNLEELSLFSNDIREIPKVISQLANLKKLSLSLNQISQIPDEIAKLTNLQELVLSNNQIVIIPNVISQITNLQTLNLSKNQISIIPNEILQLNNLQLLDLRDNLLLIPPEILEDTKNPSVILRYWQKLISDLSEIQKAFASIESIDYKSLSLRIKDLSPNDIPSYLDSHLLDLHSRSLKPLNEAKVILIGHGAVGKTSLVSQLIDRNFKSDETKTEGIDIRHWQIAAREGTVKLRVWDFGGQEIMHATHQFFLTERSLYLLVLNARKDEGNNDVEYWLKIIESFGKDAPVLIIANKSDEHPLKLNRRHLQEKYPNIQGFFETSCKTGLGVDELRKAIAQQIAAMDHVFKPLPQQWFRLKEQIEQDNRDHIPYAEYERICNEQEISDRQERRDLIRLLHLLGIVLNFAEDTRLQDTSVLNPEWVTGGVYRILNDNLLITKHKGMLNWQDLTRILTPKNKDDRNCYQENRDRQFILDMMQKFELCFPLDSNSQRPIYLIPELLDEEEPDTGTWENTLNLEYHYKILFSSVISRFIVKMHHRISKRTYWRTGVILAFPEGNRAYIKADLADAKIFIRIDGNPNTRRDSLAAIRHTFYAIHHTISALEVQERVPLSDNPEAPPVSYTHLLSLEKRGKTNYSPEGSDRDYNIRELLDGISSIEERQKFLENDLIKGINPNNQRSSIINSKPKLNHNSIMNPPKLTPERQAWLHSLTKGDTVKVWGDNYRSTTIISSVSNGYFFLKGGGDMFRTSDGYHSLLKNTWIEPPETLHTTEIIESDIKEELIESNKHLSKTTSIKAKRNPWTSGSFFLVALVVITAAFAIVSTYVPWYAFPIILIAAILAVGIVGAFQLSNDDGLTQDNFLALMLETYKRLPLLIQDKSNRDKSNPPSNTD
jgi:small GTP-binding protein